VNFSAKTPTRTPKALPRQIPITDDHAPEGFGCYPRINQTNYVLPKSIQKNFYFQNKNAFILISGSYLLNINSVESDVDFIIVLPFDYNDPKDRFVTKRMVDDEFMGIRAECNFEKREECSEKESLYCLLCEVYYQGLITQEVLDNYYWINPPLD